MATILKTKSVYYNDCNLIAQPSHPLLKSRKDIPVELNRLIVSPMDAVVGKTFAVEATRLGLSVCLHRFCDANHQLEILRAIRDENLNLSNVYVSIGLEDWDRVSILKDYTSNWLIDCANGYLSTIKNTILKLQSNVSITNLILGNIHTKEGVSLYKEFDNCGFNIMLRTGIAGGCFIPGSKVKTSFGFKSIELINVGDKVLTHTGEYCYVTNKFEYDRNEELIVINDITCTKNHEFYVIHNRHINSVNDNNIHEYARWISAENLTNEYFLIES